MSVQTELQRIIQAKADIITSIENKGVTVPSGTTIDNLDDYVDQIQQGGGGGDTGEYFYVENTTSGSGNSYTVSFKIGDTANKGSFTVNLEYSTDKENWQTLTVNRTSVSTLQPAANQKIYFRHKGTIRTKYVSSSLQEAYLVIGVNNIGLHYGGELSSLVTGNNKKINYVGDSEFKWLFNSGYYIWNQSTMKPHVYLNDDFKLPNAVNLSSYHGLFQSTTINHLPNDLLSNMELAESCYESMFANAVMNVSAPALPATTLAKNCYKYMFQNCTSLTTAPTVLPATTLAYGCYQYMFQGCSALTNAPNLPATTLAERCYQYMFYNCSSLTTVPTVLPAPTLTNYCYESMFSGCISLPTAPELPALTLKSSCYSNMFYNCQNINYIKAMFTTDISSTTSYTSTWLQGVAATGTFVKNAEATWERTDFSGIPSGWTVETAAA